MKKLISLFVVICCALIIALGCSFTASASNFYVDGNDVRMNIDDSEWYVFTRENIYNNYELDELSISYDYLYDFMHNNSVYMDAILWYNDSDYIELFVRKAKFEKIVNLSNYSDDDVLEIAEGLAGKHNTSDYGVFENQYKFIELKYYESGFNIKEYCTVVNGYNYTFTFQSNFSMGYKEYNEFDDIIDSVWFDVDESLKEPKKENSYFDAFIEGAVIAAIVGGIGALIRWRKSSKNKPKETPKSSDNSPRWKFCPMCGAEILDGKMHCPVCGAIINKR